MPTPETKAGLPVLAFPDRKALETWLETEGRRSPGIWLRLAKKESGLPSVSKAEAIDTALSFGWIDGQLDKYDGQSWLMRMTPRRPHSKWSERNRTRALELIAEGRMHPEGLTEIEAAKTDGRWEAAYAPQSTAEIPSDLQAALDANPQAAAFFGTLKGANRYAILYRIGEAKKPETRAARIAKFVAMLERRETLH
ncbi:MAG: YdeI/OmpD-associated family protein [Alphaproteobacteria bacterium]|nr:YdeI/OmpD-associated family protein [Alphaproteobacteria bacterium]